MDTDTQEDLEQEVAQSDEADIEGFAVGAPDEVDIPTTDEDTGEETTQAQAQEQEQPQQPTPQQRVYQEHEFNAVAAELRRTRRDYDVLFNRFSEMAQAINGLAKPQAQPTDEEEIVPDPNTDPAGHLNYKLDKLMKQQEEDKAKQEKERQIQTYTNEYYSARDMATQFRSQAPEVYDAAIAHLGALHRDEMLEQYPNKTEGEIINELGVAIMDNMVKWAKQGRNPGQMLYQMAVRRGFQPPQYQQQAPPPQEASGKYGNGVNLPNAIPGGKKSRVSQNAKSEIQNDLRRSAKARNVASMPGKSASRSKDAKDFLEMDEETWAKTVKGMTFQEILASRGRR